jgi:hypothetical protein
LAASLFQKAGSKEQNGNHLFLFFTLCLLHCAADLPFEKGPGFPPSLFSTGMPAPIFQQTGSQNAGCYIRYPGTEKDIAPPEPKRREQSLAVQLKLQSRGG